MIDRNHRFFSYISSLAHYIDLNSRHFRNPINKNSILSRVLLDVASCSTTNNSACVKISIRVNDITEVQNKLYTHA